MKRLGLATLLFAAWIAAMPVTAAAQTNPNLEIGIKPYGSYDSNDFDSISVTNQNLFLHIPFLSYPQRGSLTDKAYITYNGKTSRFSSGATAPRTRASRNGSGARSEGMAQFRASQS